MNPLVADRPRRVGQWMAATIFVLALWTPLIGSWLGWHDVVSIPERRGLAPPPIWTKAALPEIPTQIGEYFADHFACRISLAFVYSWIKVKILHTSSSDQVLLGKDGWLFFTGSRKIADYQGLTPPSSEECERWWNMLAGREAWLAQRGIGYLFVQVPNKITIYPEYVPDTIRRKGPHTRLDVLAPYLSQRGTTCYHDLRPVLRAERREQLLYYETGTHWNHLGAYAAYRSLSECLQRTIPALQPLGLDAFLVSYGPGESISRMLCLRDADIGVPDAPRLTLRAPHATRVPVSIPPGLPPGDTSIYATECPQATRTLLVIHDSFFMDFMRRVLPEHFARTIWVRSNGNFDHARLVALIDSFHPDVVIEERVERFMALAPTDEPAYVGALAARGASPLQIHEP